MNLLPDRRQRYAVAILMLVSLCQFVDRSIIAITLEALQREFRLDDASLGLLAGAAYSIPFAIAVLPVGALVDRVDRVTLLAILLALWSLATAASSLASTLVMLVALRAIVGAAEAGASPAALSLLASIIPPARQGLAIGAFFLASALGTIVTFGGGGYLVAEHGWRTAYLLTGLLGLVVAAVLRLTLADPERTSRNAAPRSGSALLRLLRTPAIVHLAAGSGVATALMVGLWAWAASFFTRVHGLELQEAGLIVAAGAGLCAGAGILLAGRLTDRINDMSAALMIPLAALAAAAVAFVALATARSEGATIAAFLTASFFAPMFLAPSYAAILSLAGAENRGMALAGLQIATNLLGGTIGPAAIGIIASATGSLELGLALLSLAGPWAGLHFLLARRRMRRGSTSPAASGI